MESSIKEGLFTLFFIFCIVIILIVLYWAIRVIWFIITIPFRILAYGRYDKDSWIFVKEDDFRCKITSQPVYSTIDVNKLYYNYDIRKLFPFELYSFYKIEEYVTLTNGRVVRQKTNNYKIVHRSFWSMWIKNNDYDF